MSGAGVVHFYYLLHRLLSVPTARGDDLEVRTLGGALEAQTLGGALEARMPGVAPGPERTLWALEWTL